MISFNSPGPSRIVNGSSLSFFMETGFSFPFQSLLGQLICRYRLDSFLMKILQAY